ncbi:MAG TPA: sigma-54 dependent transcriptional regulator [Candidatus Angelobacter sp.]
MVERLQGLALGDHGERLVGESPAFLQTLRRAAKVVPHHYSRVLILGESGTGKELVARAIHCLGVDSDKPWVAVNIGETPGTLVEAALFGHEKGAFTDARELRKGLLEVAADGTLFLDEVGDLELPLQGKLLRVIQEREFRRLGGNTPMPFNARLICATNVELADAVQEGAFRRDLYHRIAELVIQVPPLRDRPADIERLIDHFLKSYDHRPVRFARETLSILRSYPFPGNIRELQNLVKSAVIQADGDVVLARHLPLANMEKFLHREAGQPVIGSKPASSESESLIGFVATLKGTIPEEWMKLKYRQALQAVERAFDRVYLQRHLEKTHHNVTRAAASADMDTKTFRKHWKDCGLPPLTADDEQ